MASAGSGEPAAPDDGRHEMHVHPLPPGGHTWRDFLFHMATIAAGLLLAIALEHAVEVWHARGGEPVAYPGSWDDEMRRMGRAFGIPTSSVWTTAGASGAVRLLPRVDAFAYARLYFMHDLVVAFDVERRKSVAAVRAAERMAGAGPDGIPALGTATPAELDALAAAIAHEQAVDAHFGTLLAGYRALNEAVLAGDRTGDLPVDDGLRRESR